MVLRIALTIIVITISSCSTSTKRSEFCDYYTVKYFNVDDVKDQGLVVQIMTENETWFEMCDNNSLTTGVR